MRKLVWICFFLLVIGFPQQAVGQQNVPILLYHSIDEYYGQGSKELYVTPENFERQMNYLKTHGYTLLTFERWEDINKVNKPILITFDDGYNNVQNALAIFEKLKDKNFQPTATIFVISDFTSRQNRLSEVKLKQMAQSGMFSIQSHTATHPDLTKTKNYKYELKESKQKIEQITGKPVIALAYPYGNFNDEVVKETKKYYLFGVTTTPGAFSEKGIKNEKYLLPRIYIKYSTTLEDFKRLLK